VTTDPFTRGDDPGGWWGDSAPQLVAPGVHRLPLPLPDDNLHAVNVYVIDLPDGIAMIDGGWAMVQSQAALESGLAALGRDISDVREIFVTHIHRDHYTQAVRLRQLVGARVHLGSGERPGLRMLNDLRANTPVNALRLLQRAGEGALSSSLVRSGGFGPFDATMWEEPDTWLEAGRLQIGERKMRVVATPGHTRGHVVFLDEEQHLLFAGDHVLPHITPSIGFELAEPGLPLGDYLESLQLLRLFADARLLPAHGHPAPSVHARVGELIAHHDLRLGQAAGVVDELLGATAGEVARRLTWTGRQRPFDGLDDFNKMLAVCETAAHLDVLVVRGVLTVSELDGVDVYARGVPSGKTLVGADDEREKP
jgi:glyoxylase-like metal-dependent hydrolase (beta-lactamase superfamily II)